MATNQANKIVINGETRIDLTEDTVSAGNVVNGLTFHAASGASGTGTMPGLDAVEFGDIEDPVSRGYTDAQYYEAIAEALSLRYQKGGDYVTVGTVIAVMGVTPPAGYLKCDGTVYDIADYPGLAAYFYQQFGSKNYFGGDGTTTFAVPDLQGEFLRGTGTNSHADQGSGDSVGVHQDATLVATIFTVGAEAAIYAPSKAGSNQAVNADHTVASTHRWQSVASSNGDVSRPAQVATRPTNTSVLFCIAYRDTYVNGAKELDYSTDEQVVGRWIDGKPVYQITVTTGGSVPSGATLIYRMTMTGYDTLQYTKTTD